MAVTLRITTDTKPIDAVRRAVELVDAAFAKAGDTVVAMGVKMDAEHAKIMRHMRDEIAAQQQLNTLRNSGLTSLGSHYAASQQQLQQLIATQNQFNTAMQSGNQQSSQAIQQQIQALQQQLLLMQQIAAQSNQQPAPGGGGGGGPPRPRNPGGGGRGGGGNGPGLLGGLSGEGGPLYQYTRAAAEMNILPYGYERFGMRLARGVEFLGRWTAAVGVAAAGTALLGAAIQRAADDPKYRGFETLRRYIDDSNTSIVTMTRNFDSLIGFMARGVKVATDFAAIPIAQTMAGLSGTREFDFAGGRDKFQKSLRDARAERGSLDSVRAHRQMLTGISDMGQGRDLAEAGGASFGRESQAREMFDRKTLADLAARKEDALKRESMLVSTGGTELSIKQVQEEIALIDDKTEAIKRNAAAERRQERLQFLRDSVQTTRFLAQVEKERAGQNFDAQRVVTLKEINKEIEREKFALSLITDASEESSRRRAEGEKRITELMARRQDEIRREIALRQRFADIASKFSDSGDDITIDNLKAEQTERDKIRKQSADRINMLRDAGILSDEEANEQERILAASNDELKTLEKIQQVERERLEREKKRADEQRAAAKDAQQAHEAEERQMKAISDAADMAARHARERAAAERNIAEAQRDQEATELRRKQQQEVENMRKALDERRKQMGTLSDRVGEQVDPRRQMLGLLMNRSRAAIAEEEKKRGRKLSVGELQKVMTRERRNLVNQARGPSERQKALELARQRGIQRRQAQEDAKKRSKLPPNLRRMESELRRGDLRRGEDERQKAASDGRLASGMNADFNRDMAGERNKFVQQQIDALERSGQVNKESAETMRNAANALANHEREMADLQQKIAIINQQIESVSESNKRRAAQRQGNGR